MSSLNPSVLIRLTPLTAMCLQPLTVPANKPQNPLSLSAVLFSSSVTSKHCFPIKTPAQVTSSLSRTFLSFSPKNKTHNPKCFFNHCFAKMRLAPTLTSLISSQLEGNSKLVFLIGASPNASIEQVNQFLEVGRQVAKKVHKNVK